MRNDAADIARQLARNAEAVCRYYLRNGRKQGRYWLIGDVDNTPGRSLYVRLSGPYSGKGAAGKWTEHVALRFMLRPRISRLVCCYFREPAQHNVRTQRGIS